MKTILGLDIGTNSIGWALIKRDFENNQGEIIDMGSRIIPMTQDKLNDFEKGNSISQTAERTSYRGFRRLRERHLLRRERLHRVLNVLNFLPSHFASKIDFEKRLGKFKDDSEPKLAYDENGFLFMESYQEMLKEFSKHQAQLLENNKRIPYDWTIYYLRKKALKEKISKEELAWVILNFNQKRGYYQLRGEDLEKEDNKKFVVLKGDRVVDTGEKTKDNKILYDLYFDNGWKYDKPVAHLEFWIGKEKEFIVTEKKLKSGEIKRTYKDVNLESDWIAIKTKTEQDINTSDKTVGSFIFDSLLQNPDQKIRGKLVRTIERKYYKEELIEILKKQIALQPELFSKEKLEEAIHELYKNNRAHQNLLKAQDFIYLFINDIIFYQRPLKSQKSSISECSLEYRIYKTKDENGNEINKKQYLKAIPKSHPLYQEFRIWQWINNFKIYLEDNNEDVTSLFLETVEDYEFLFEEINSKASIKQNTLLKAIVAYKKNIKGKALTEEIKKYRWNYVEDKEYPGNTTKTQILSRLKKVEGIKKDFLKDSIEAHLWHIIYSVTDKNEFIQALKKFANKYNLDEESFVDNFKNIPPYASDYGAFSMKAIKKLLPLMRIGKYWSWDNIDDKTKNRIEKIQTGEFDESISLRVREQAINLKQNEDFHALPLYMAQYIVYGRHSEAGDVQRWTSISDLEKYLKNFKQHSLRNPIVEQVVTETLRVVKDIWSYYGKGEEGYFDEIHVELSRDMKNPSKTREKITKRINENENTNLRIKYFLMELVEDSNVEGVRPYSPMHQEILKIYEDGVLNSGIDIPEDIEKISKTPQPSSSDFQRYKLWLEQKYKSPYTGQIIPLNKLFTTAYEIEHVIPQSRYFDDSFSNKVICESSINKLKDKQLAYEFIQNHGGQKVSDGNKVLEVLKPSAYEDFVKNHYKNNRTKRTKLLMDEIPEQMIQRQMNDTRYISKFVSTVLSNIVRSEIKDDGINSKNLIPVYGKITNTLKQDWGLNNVWNSIILPRFERLNELTNSTDYTALNSQGKTIPTVPLELSKGFSKKRIDHRHHALDALIIAAVTKDHVNLLNNQSANASNKRFDLQNKLRNKESYIHKKSGQERKRFTDFKKPWEGFTSEAKNALEDIVVSFKQNLRVINKTNNKYEKYVEEKGRMVKKVVTQTKGDNWAIRKPLHKETVSGKVDLPRVKVPKGKILTATRNALDDTFTEKKIKSITDTGIQKILLNYLQAKNNDPKLAFTPEGIEEMNNNIEKYNNGKKHQPIYKVRLFETGTKFQVGYTGNKSKKYVEAAKGTNLFFAIYEDKNGKRYFDTIPLNIVIERQKQGLGAVPEKDEKGNSLLMYLSPNDLVYVPEEGENVDVENLDRNRIYKMVSANKTQCFFIPYSISIPIYNKKEFSALNKMERSIEGIMIKSVCLKLQINRLGLIKLI